MSPKYLIINADDFGMSPEFNIAIKNLLTNGNISSASLMANGLYYEEAIELQKKYNLQNIGIHLTLTRDAFDTTSPLLYNSISRKKSIEDNNGLLYTNSKDLYIHAKENDIKREITCQINKIAKDNIIFSHIDNHMYSIIPRMGYYGYKILFNALKELRINRKVGIRIPYNYYNIDNLNYIWSGRKILPYLWINKKFLNLYSPKYSFAFPYYANNIPSIIEKKKCLENFFKSLKPGVTELHFHPCIYSDNLKTYNPYWEHRVQEYELLLNIDAKNLRGKYGIILTNWQNLISKNDNL